SGRGKTTLAASFMTAGYRLLTDDLLHVREFDGILCGFPGPARLKLFSHTVEQLKGAKAPEEDIDVSEGKLIVSLSVSEAHDAPVPLRAIYVLAEPSTGLEVSIEPLAEGNALVTMVAATFNTQITDNDRLRRQFAAAQQLSKRLPIRRLHYPRTIAALEQVRR